jgi:hypothetical protein
MRILDAIRNRRSSAETPVADAGSPDADQLAIPGYERLGHREIGLRLPELSQVELAAVETYERSHDDRPEVLAKLRYMQTKEPLPDYDALSPEQIAEGLAGADAEKVKAVRDYERKFGHRREVLDEAARVLPDSPASEKEDRVREEKAERVRASTR